jgi:large subunit ribosomal protein L10
MPRAEKVEKVNNIKKHLEESNSVFITDYTGLDVADITVLRKDLRENSVKYLVAKNTLLRIAAKEAGYDNILDYLQGQTAIAFAQDDPAAAAKILYDSYKDIEKPLIKAFVLEDVVYSGEDIKRLAELPPKDILLAQLVSAVEAPIASVVMSLEAVFQELFGTLDALAKSKEG